MRPLLIATIAAMPLLAAPAALADTTDPISKLFGPDAPECVPMAELRAYAKTTELTPEQFQFARALFVAMPPIWRQLPPGDHGFLATADDGVTFIALVNGDQSCAVHRAGLRAGYADEGRRGRDRSRRPSDVSGAHYLTNPRMSFTAFIVGRAISRARWAPAARTRST